MDLHEYLLKKIPPFNPENVLEQVEATIDSEDWAKNDYSLFIHIIDEEKFQIAQSKLISIRQKEYLLINKEFMTFFLKLSSHAEKFQKLSHLDPLDRVYFIKHDFKIMLTKYYHVLPNESYSDWNGNYENISLSNDPTEVLHFILSDLNFKVAVVIYNMLNKFEPYNALPWDASIQLSNPSTQQIKTKIKYELDDILLPIASTFKEQIINSLELSEIKFFLKKSPGVTGVSFFQALKDCSYISSGISHGPVVFHSIWTELNPKMKLSVASFKTGKITASTEIVEFFSRHLPKIV